MNNAIPPSIALEAKRFKTWLEDRGAIVLEPTNPYEVVRFKTSWGISVLYCNKKGHLAHTGESRKAYEAFHANKDWKGVNRKRQNMRSRKEKLAQRDGCKCFFCHVVLELDVLTVEHLVAIMHGGPDHPSNLVLACSDCNLAVDRLPVAQKMLYRDKMLAQKDIAYYVKEYLGYDLFPAQLKILERARTKIDVPTMAEITEPPKYNVQGMRIDLEPF